jgi:hypothetical protein
MVVSWSKLGVYASHLQRIDRIDSRNPVQICRSAADRFYWFYIPRRILDCTGKTFLSGVAHDRGFRVDSAAWLYLWRASPARREARSCRRALVIAGKSEAPVDASRITDIAYLSFPFALMRTGGNCAATVATTRGSSARRSSIEPVHVYERSNPRK